MAITTAVTDARTAFRAGRAERVTRRPRTPLLVRAARLAAKHLPAWSQVRSVAMNVAGFAGIDYGIWTANHTLGLIAAGVSLLILDYLSGER